MKISLKLEPVAVGTVIIALVGVGAALGLSGKLAAALTALTTAVVGLFVRQAVVPTGKVAGAVTEAATQAAETAVREVGAETVGRVGEVTNAGLHVVGEAAQLATTAVLDTIGITGRRAA